MGMKSAFFALGLMAGVAAAEDVLTNPWVPWGEGHLTFYLDNDLFAGSDKDYTNGARLSWISGDQDPKRFGPFQQLLRRLNGDRESLELFQTLGGMDPNEIRYQYGVALTQLMYTPEDLDVPEPPAGERPYAGWSGLGFSLHTKDRNTLNSIELVFGILGPHSYAEETQDFIHSIRDIEKARGWDSQIPDEPTVNLYYTQRRRLRFLESGDTAQFSIDGNAEWGWALGNFRTDAKGGVLVRAGWNLPYDFSDPRLSETSNSQRLFVGDVVEGGNWSAYFIGGARVNTILHDATLDGPVFRDFDTDVDKEWLVGEVYAGFGLSYRAWEMSYVHTFRTKEYETQDGGSEFGSIAIRYRF